MAKKVREQGYKVLLEKASRVRKWGDNQTYRERFRKVISKSVSPEKLFSSLPETYSDSAEVHRATITNFMFPPERQAISKHDRLQAAYCLLTILHDKIYEYDSWVTPISVDIWSLDVEWIEALWEQMKKSSKAVAGGDAEFFDKIDFALKLVEADFPKLPAETEPDTTPAKEEVEKAKPTTSPAGLLKYLNFVLDDIERLEGSRRFKPYVDKYIRTELATAYHETKKAVKKIRAQNPAIKETPADSNDPREYLRNVHTWCVGQLFWENGERIGETPAETGQEIKSVKKPSEAMTEKDRQLFSQIAIDVREHPNRYSRAGKCLDKYCEERRQIPQIRRFAEARQDLLKKYEKQDFIPEDDAIRILLITWLLTDADAQKTNPNITQFAGWPWKPTDDITSGSRCAASSLWCKNAYGYDRWMRLVRIAWKTVDTQKPIETEQKEIVEVKPGAFGITVNIKEIAKRIWKCVCSRSKD